MPRRNPLKDFLFTCLTYLTVLTATLCKYLLMKTGIDILSVSVSQAEDHLGGSLNQIMFRQCWIHCDKVGCYDWLVWKQHPKPNLMIMKMSLP